MTAGEIKQALDASARRRGDLFFEEVDLSHAIRGGRLDALRVRRSWCPAETVGYEIKVSRGDWLRDDKWTAYAEAVNCLSLVCPRGVVKKDEIPEGVGLIYMSPAGRPWTARKAPRREVEPRVAWAVYHSLLVNRVQLSDARWTAEDWQRAVERSEREGRIGRDLRVRISRLAAQQIRAAEDRALSAERGLQQMKEARDVLREFGWDEGSPTWRLRDQLRRVSADSRLEEVRGALDAASAMVAHLIADTGAGALDEEAAG